MGKVLNQYLKFLGYDNRPEFLDRYLKVPSMQRLKKVGYFCGMDYASKDIYDFKEYVSRYDHSLNVALITWNFTHDKVSTLAGLFHDISTPVFSHVIDYMNKDYSNQESTESFMYEVVCKDKELLRLLKEDGISVDEILFFKNYSVVDLPRPLMCADRLDGIILPGLFWAKEFDLHDVATILSDLCIFLNKENTIELGFKSPLVAAKVVDMSEKIDELCHSDEDNYMMELLATITRRAMELGFIQYKELYLITENEFFERLLVCDNSEIMKLIYRFRTITSDRIKPTSIPDLKVRDLDPLVLGQRMKTRQYIKVKTDK